LVVIAGEDFDAALLLGNQYVGEKGGYAAKMGEFLLAVVAFGAGREYLDHHTRIGGSHRIFRVVFDATAHHAYVGVRR